MKKIIVLALSLMLILGLCISASAAEESHPHTGDHCVCGGAAVGVGDHTVCEAIQWQPLSEALKAVDLTMSTANFGKLPSGNYYLDGDVVVTGANTIGSKSDSLKTEPDTVVELTICLNGYDITRSKDTGKIFGYLHMDSVLNICDCSYDGSTFGGTVAGGSNDYGSIIYTYSRSTLNIYGGSFTGKGYTNGGAIIAACDGCGDVDGNGKYEEKDRGKAESSVMNLYNGHISGSTVTANGGTIQLFHPSCLNVYGGTIVGGTAGGSGGAISASSGTVMIAGGNIIGGTATGNGGIIYSSSGKVYITGGTMTGGTGKSGTEAVQVIQNDGKLLGTYVSFAEGLAKAQNASNCYLRLLNDLETSDTVSGTLYLDLNGHTLKGIHITGTLYGMDCTTNFYDDSAAGSLIPASGKPQTQVKTTVAQTGAVRRYLALETEGSYSFHRFYLGITKVTLKPGTVGMGYKATYAGGERVAAALKQTLGFGYKMWLTEDVVISRGYNADRFEKIQELTLRIDNFLDANATAAENAARAEMDVHAVAYLRLADGTEITSAEACYDLHQMVELADDAYAGFNAAQKDALNSLSAQFSQIMLSWDVENTHHADGSMWQKVDSAAFMKKLTLYNSASNQYRIAAGSYVLSENIDLGSRRLRLDSGKTVNLCLNGFTIKTTNRMFEQYGTLNICDCHESGSEGTMLSTQAGETATYASVAYCRYNSVTNLYGGNLKASGKVTSAGVLALSHDGSAANTAKPAAVMNMYGGSVSGGQVYGHGGLISVWNNATFNMYGGELHGGSADGRGGGIDANNGTINILGGSIYGNTAGTSGGGIFSDGPKVKINISGCKITDNTATNNGGNLYLGQGTYSIADTTITGGQGTKGGGIMIYNCQAEVSNVTLKNNTARTLGGAIYASGNSLNLQITGGQISGNTASELGGGVYLTKSSVTLSGDVKIKDNTGSNLYMDFYSAADADGLTEGADVGITPEAMTVLGTNEQVIPYISCDSTDYTVRQAYGKVTVLASDVTPVSSVSGFQVGFGESNITPEVIDGIPLAGFSNPTERLAVDEGRMPYDDIMAQSVAITDEKGETVILIFCDLIRSDADPFDYIVDAVSAATGVPEDHIFINCSHSHSVPSLSTTSVPAQVEYNRTLPNLFARSALQAMNDRAPATMETGSFEVQNTVNGKTQYYNFYRHYSYEEDGIVKYFGDQFGTATYNSTTKPIRDADHTMHLVRFVRNGKDILMSNWRIHPHFTGGESKYLLSADAIGTIRYYMAQKLPDTHYVYFQGAAGNINETSRLTITRANSGLISASQVQNHGLNYVQYGKAVAQIIVDNLGCLESEETGLLQVDHYDYVAKADTPSDEEYAKAKEVYDIFVVETKGMTLSQQNAWVLNYCAEHPEYNFVSGFQLSFIVNRRYNQKDTVLPLNVVTLGKSFALFTAPFELWDSISMEVEEKSPFKTTFCLGYSMDHQHYMVYYPEYLDEENGVPYVSYESENRHFAAPETVQDMIKYWTETLKRFYNN